MNLIEQLYEKPFSKILIRINPKFIQSNELKLELNLDENLFEKIFNYIFYNKINENNNNNKEFLILIKKYYSIFHEKFLNTIDGQELMYFKYKNDLLPKCPRIFCNKMSCFPISIKEDSNKLISKLYCPKCEQIYNFSTEIEEEISGDFFGTVWLEKFLIKYPELTKKEIKTEFIPRIFGFKIKPTLLYEKIDIDQNFKIK